MLLGIETSCDDTCAAVVSTNGEIRSNVISSQAQLHARYGGVVPEVASRHHLELINSVVAEALGQAGTNLDGIDTVAATSRPGLIGALLVGLSTAKALAATRGVPFVAVDHLHGHVAANYLEPDPIDPPFLCLIASGGHTLLARVEQRSGYETLGATRDDAAGEALDKAARLLGLGYPGGAEIDRLARKGDPEAFAFPVGMRGSTSLDFSFSGLKTAFVYRVRELGSQTTQDRLADLAASFQRAVVDSLMLQLERAVTDTGARRLAVGGGVAANNELRERLTRLSDERGIEIKMPPSELCTDNAAMIASAGRYIESVPYPDFLAFDAFARVAA
ncbi:MAG: tRNA (adenosine(37)-N6)-threonylcarbamoyltransferase complex transferase subunit TsaD [Solirubrobacterales bacterium]